MDSKLKSIIVENFKSIVDNNIVDLKDTINKYNSNKIIFHDNEKIYFDGRINSLRRSINNLIDNALKYGSKVDVSLNKSMNNIHIFVDDNGSGIEKKERINVFKPFYKIDKSRNETKSSVGLGLSIASDIIKSHGGNISLEKSPYNGLRVKISLPF